MDPEQKKRCSDVLNYFLKLDNTDAFRERVNWEEWGLYDYLQVVKEPMDLGTIRNKLNSGEYRKPADFAYDMRLVWDNCKLYNQDGSALYVLADELSAKFEERIKAMKLDVGTTRADKRVPPPSTEEKIHFSQNIYKIPSKILGEVVDMLTEKCPKALDKSSPDEIDIVLDSIDGKTFREVQTFVLEHVPEGSREPIVTPKNSNRKSGRSGNSSSSSSKRTRVA